MKQRDLIDLLQRPATLYEPDNTIHGLALFGYGLGVHRYHETVVQPAAVLADQFGFASLVPELPLHGDRQAPDGADIVQQWQTYWEGKGRSELLEEWSAWYEIAKQEFPDLPIVYFGLSLGTQYGVLYLSQAKQIEAAVLGLFGSEPAPKSMVMNHCAPKIQMPVYFIQKQDDEIHPKTNTDHLFQSLGSTIKEMDSTAGQHAAVGLDSIQQAGQFLLTHARR